MSRMTCTQCGAEEEDRTMTVCPRCGSVVCPRCTGQGGGLCVRCESDMNNIQDIL